MCVFVCLCVQLCTHTANELEVPGCSCHGGATVSAPSVRGHKEAGFELILVWRRKREERESKKKSEKLREKIRKCTATTLISDQCSESKKKIFSKYLSRPRLFYQSNNRVISFKHHAWTHGYVETRMCYISNQHFWADLHVRRWRGWSRWIPLDSFYDEMPGQFLDEFVATEPGIL